MIDVISILLLLLTVTFATGRNLLSKNISGFTFGNKSFFLIQVYIFISGGIILAVFTKFEAVATLTIVYAFSYALFLILAQWFYTIALGFGKISICSTIYSMGFILPTLSGTIFWNEKFTLFDLLGVGCVVIAIIVSGVNKTITNNVQNKNKYFVPILIAMLSSGGLGIIQKLQQKSPCNEQKGMFVMIAFFISGIISFLFYMFAKEGTQKTYKKDNFTAGGVGICFGCCNIINTTLAGKLDSALFFPLQNISVILLSIVLSRLILKERLGKKELFVLLFGAIAIVLLNI
ncbi:MAG: EamA family transporter [Bacillota bacterium]|nr:EamA family transporter [Bacillota bacterium]